MSTVITRQGNTATQSQIKFINDLRDQIVQKGGDGPVLHEIMQDARTAWYDGDLTKSVASDVIDLLIGVNRQIKTEVPEAPEGMHQFGGNIWKVQRSPETGHVYAKVLEEDGSTVNGWTFTYVPGGVKNLSEGTRLTMEAAKEFGSLYGTCCVCSRTLTNEDSIEAGIGPICSGKIA